MEAISLSLSLCVCVCVCAASKSFMDTWCEALQMELKQHNVTVQSAIAGASNFLAMCHSLTCVCHVCHMCHLCV